MNVALKKLAIRWVAIEVIVTLSVLAVTPFLFGSIKPLKPLAQITNNTSIELNTDTELALKKANVKKTQQVVSNVESTTTAQKADTKKAASVEEAEIIEDEPVDDGTDKVRTIQPVGKTIIIDEPVEVETPSLIK